LPAIAERLDGFDDVLIEPFVPDGAVVALDIGVLLRLAGLDMPNADASPRCPFQQFAADVFRAVVRRLAVDCMAINEKGRE
jgi:hypothetical protein